MTETSEEEDGEQPVTLAVFREDVHALRGALNSLVLKVELMYQLLLKMTEKPP